jgi:hypothetical protein
VVVVVGWCVVVSDACHCVCVCCGSSVVCALRVVVSDLIVLPWI